MPVFYTTFVPKMPEFYIMFARKNIFRDFFLGGGGGNGGGQPLTPISYAYGWAPGPHQLNPALHGNETSLASGYNQFLWI